MMLLLVSLIALGSSTFTSAGNKLSNTSYTEANGVAEMIAKLEEKVDSFSEYCKLVPKACGPCRCKDDDRLVEKYFCDCQNLPARRDCLEFYQRGLRTNGVYKVHQNHMRTIQVFCDHTSDGGGWTVFQRRTDGSVKFYRDWRTYKLGFGQLQNEFWLGNDNIFTMSLQGLFPKGSELRVDLEDWAGVKKWAKYADFQVGNENVKYIANFKGYSGNAGDSLSYHNTMQFSTFDNDNDKWKDNCGSHFKGGFWFKDCEKANINGRYYNYAEFPGTWLGVYWYTFHSGSYSLKFTEMKIRRKI